MALHKSVFKCHLVNSELHKKLERFTLTERLEMVVKRSIFLIALRSGEGRGVALCNQLLVVSYPLMHVSNVGNSLRDVHNDRHAKFSVENKHVEKIIFSK